MLTVAAGYLPIQPDAPSLWPSIESRIVNRHAPALTRWPKLFDPLISQSIRRWVDRDRICSLQHAWTHDTLREMLSKRTQTIILAKKSSGLLWKAGLAAIILFALTGIGISHERWRNAQFIVTANSAPSHDSSPVPALPDQEPPLEVETYGRNDIPPNQLADAEPTHSPEISPSAAEAVAAPKQSPRIRFGFDLEHGTPMPPDTREARPVY
jgi:hypothetical protein